MKHQHLTMEAMNENGWNAITLPIPVDASKELLIEAHTWTDHFSQIFVDTIRGDDGPVTHAAMKRAKKKLRIVERRALQVEWRLNVMGLFQGWPDWQPPEKNEYVKFLIEKMARPGEYDVPWARELFRLEND